MVVTNVDELISALQCDAPQWGLLAIDGWDGAGKTTLGAEIAALSGATQIDLDPFVRTKGVSFVDGLDRHILSGALKVTFGPIVITGVCALRVLELLGRRADRHVYVKRMLVDNQGWYWADEDDAEGNGLAGLASVFPFHADLREYHDRYRPHKLADYEFQRLDSR